MSHQRGLRKSRHRSREKAGAKEITEGKGRINSRWTEWSIVLNVLKR